MNNGVVSLESQFVGRPCDECGGELRMVGGWLDGSLVERARLYRCPRGHAYEGRQDRLPAPLRSAEHLVRTPRHDQLEAATAAEGGIA